MDAVPSVAAFVASTSKGTPLSHLVRTHQHCKQCPRRPRGKIQIRNSASAARPYPSSSSDEGPESASANVNTPPPPSGNGPVWESISGCQVVTVPSAARPVAVVRFTGGFGAGVAPRALYGKFLEEIAKRGNVAVVAAPVNPSFDHLALASDAAEKLGAATRELVARWDVPWIPTFGMGHSLGSKVQLLASCDEDSRQAQGPSVANILISFNNFNAKQSIPMWDAIRTTFNQPGTEKSIQELGKVADFLRNLDLAGLSGGRASDSIDKASEVLKKVGDTITSVTQTTEDEFTPSAEETLQMVSKRYSVPENLLISFSRDTLDQSDDLEPVLNLRFGKRGAVVRKLDGTHVTPLTPNLGEGGTRDFASVGSPTLDEEIRKAAGGVASELNATVSVVVAFLRLHLEVLAEKRMLP